MNQPFVHTKQQELDSAVAFLIAAGILLGLGGLMAAFDLFASRERNVLQLASPFRRIIDGLRFCSQTQASPCLDCIHDNLLLGVSLVSNWNRFFGMLMVMIWRVRSTYHLSLKMPQAEQTDPGNPPSAGF